MTFPLQPCGRSGARQAISSTSVHNLWTTRKRAFTGQAVRALDHSHVDDAAGGRCGERQLIRLDALQHHESVERHRGAALHRSVAF